MDSLGLALFGSSLTGTRCVHVASDRGNVGSRQLVINAPSSGWDLALCTVTGSLFQADTVYAIITPSSGTVYVNSAYAIVSTLRTITYKLTSDGEMAAALIFYAAFLKYN